MNKNYLKKYNTADTLAVISSYPEKDGEVAVENAIARYTKLLLQNYPSYRKIVVFCEKRNDTDLVREVDYRILVVPTYTVGSLKFAPQVVAKVKDFDRVIDYLIQFEFSIFGGKESILGILSILSALSSMKKETSIMLHQVVTDISTLSGHLGLSKNAIKTKMFNNLLKIFYISVGLLSKWVFVHDSVLKNRLSTYVKEDKIAVIAHGMQVEKTVSSREKAMARKKWGINEKDYVVLAFGYQSWYKGTDWIVENVGKLSKKYPERNIKLLLAGDKSPTLKNTDAYKKFSKNLKKVIGKYKNVIIETGFVAEEKVKEVFAVSDVVIFPYRTRMSASGAFSVACSYGVPYLVSKPFSSVFNEPDLRKILNVYEIQPRNSVFDMNGTGFEKALMHYINNPKAILPIKKVEKELVEAREWSNVALMYDNFIQAHYNEVTSYEKAMAEVQVSS